MINLNLDALKKVTEEISGSNQFLTQKDLTPDLYVRLIPSLPNIADLNFFIEHGYWINRARYVSPKSFGRPCPIEEELEEARANAADNPELKTLLDQVSNKPVFLFPVIKVDVKGSTGTPENKAKILQVGPQLGKAIISIIANPPGCTIEDIFAQDGYVIRLNKQGSGMKTEYSAQLTVMKVRVPDEAYNNPPDIYEFEEKKLKTDDELRRAIRTYLYGDDNADVPSANIEDFLK